MDALPVMVPTEATTVLLNTPVTVPAVNMPDEATVPGSGSRNFLRKTLVVSQFVISISLIICIGIVYKQLNYIHNKDLGFSKDQIMTIDFGFNQFNNYNSFKSELLKNPEVQSVSLLGGSIPGKAEVIENSFVQGGMPQEQQQWFSVMFTGHDFEKVLDVEFIEGHSFQVGNSADSVGYILNESAAKALEWNSDVIGRTLDQVGNGNVQQSGTVIGRKRDGGLEVGVEPVGPLPKRGVVNAGIVR